MMERKMFKTNINCGSCVEKVTATLDETAGKGKWEVDTLLPIKLLTVNNEMVTALEIQDSLKKIGYTAILIG